MLPNQEAKNNAQERWLANPFGGEAKGPNEDENNVASHLNQHTNLALLHCLGRFFPPALKAKAIAYKKKYAGTPGENDYQAVILFCKPEEGVPEGRASADIQPTMLLVLQYNMA